MSITKEVRKESYEKSKPKFSSQERHILNCIKGGYTTAWEIHSNSFNMLITSIRRALSDLVKDDVIDVIGKRHHKATNRDESVYKIKPFMEKELGYAEETKRY